MRTSFRGGRIGCVVGTAVRVEMMEFNYDFCNYSIPQHALAPC